MNDCVTKKEQLIEVAARLFYEQGYHVTGIKQIIDAAGIAKGTFYCHFKSKEELGLAWLQTRHAIQKELREDFLVQFGEKPDARILGLFDFLRQWMSDCNYRGCAFLNTLAETPDFTCPMRKEIKRHKQELLDYIRQLVDQLFGSETEEKNQQRAGVIYLLFEAAMIEIQNFRDAWPIDIATKQVRAILLQKADVA